MKSQCSGQQQDANYMIQIEHPNEFKEGVRILMRCKRNKDGEGNSGGDRASKKIITTDSEEFDEALERLMLDIQPGERIYSTVDARDFQKGIRNFKFKQLEAEYYDDGSRFRFYTDSFNRMVSSLQAPNARVSSYFLFDCDSVEESLTCMTALSKVDLHKNIIHDYKTKNGKHIITQPFNPALLPEEVRSLIQKNAMMLWVY